MAKKFLTDEQVEQEIERLKKSMPENATNTNIFTVWKDILTEIIKLKFYNIPKN